MTDDLRYRRCQTVKAMLKDPMWNEAIATIHVDLMNELLATDLLEPEKREAVFFESKALSRIVGKLTSFANEATVEDSKIEKLRRGTFHG